MRRRDDEPPVDVAVVVLFRPPVSRVWTGGRGFGSEKRRSLKAREFWDKYRPKDVPSEAERASLAEIYGAVARAYSNGQVSVIRPCGTQISNRVVNLDYHVYDSLSGGTVKLLLGNFLASRSLKKIGNYCKVNRGQ